MDICNTMLSAGYIVNEELAREVFEVLPDGGAILAIVDSDGHHWNSDPQAFAQLDLEETLLDDLRAQVDDGAEPAVAHVAKATVVAAQLRTEETNCGYLFLAVP